MRANKSGVAAMEAEVGAPVDLLLLAAAKTENDFIFLSDNFGEINVDVRSVDTPARSVSSVVSNLRAVDHCFGGRAAEVDACAAQILFLYKRDRPAQIREPIRERIAGLA